MSGVPTSIKLTKDTKEALEFLRKHPEPFILNQEVCRMVIRRALELGWREDLPRPRGARREPTVWEQPGSAQPQAVKFAVDPPKDDQRQTVKPAKQVTNDKQRPMAKPATPVPGTTQPQTAKPAKQVPNEDQVQTVRAAKHIPKDEQLEMVKGWHGPSEDQPRTASVKMEEAHHSTTASLPAPEEVVKGHPEGAANTDKPGARDRDAGTLEAIQTHDT